VHETHAICVAVLVISISRQRKRTHPYSDYVDYESDKDNLHPAHVANTRMSEFVCMYVCMRLCTCMYVCVRVYDTLYMNVYVLKFKHVKNLVVCMQLICVIYIYI